MGVSDLEFPVCCFGEFVCRVLSGPWVLALALAGSLLLECCFACCGLVASGNCRFIIVIAVFWLCKLLSASCVLFAYDGVL